MINKQFIQAMIKMAIYARKSDTKSSYYYQSGDRLLPNRLSVDFYNTITHATNKGRILTEKVLGEVRGEFKKKEESPLKLHCPYKLQSRIFRKVEFPQLAGYATIAISDSNGRISAESEVGVLVFNRIDTDTVQLFYMAGKCTPELILSVCEYVTNLIENGKAIKPSQVGF